MKLRKKILTLFLLGEKRGERERGREHNQGKGRERAKERIPSQMWGSMSMQDYHVSRYQELVA